MSPSEPSAAAAAAATDAAADDVIKQKQPERATHLHTKPKGSRLQLSKLEVRYPDLFKAINSLEPTFIVLHPDGVWLQPRVFEGLKRSGFSYLNRWINENPEKCKEVSHHGMMVLNCLGMYKRFTTYDEIAQYLEDRGMANAFFLQADACSSRQKGQGTLNPPAQQPKERVQLEKLVKDLEDQLQFDKEYRAKIEREIGEGKDPCDTTDRVDKVIGDVLSRLEQARAALRQLDDCGR